MGRRSHKAGRLCALTDARQTALMSAAASRPFWMVTPKKPRTWAGLKSMVLSFETLPMEVQTRESSDNPILNAFCRVAPSLRFNALAILAAGFLFLASDFNVRTCSDVHARRFDTFLVIQITPGLEKGRLCSWKLLQRKAKNTLAGICLNKREPITPLSATSM